LGVIAILAASVLILSATSCSRPTTSQATPHNLIVVTVDTLRADHVDAERMPELARLRQEAITFEQAVSTGSVTLPAHASLLTGLNPPRHGVRDNTLFSLATDVPTFQSALRERGYATAALVSAIVLDSRYGLDRGFDAYDDEFEGDQLERDAPTTLARARAWIGTAREPFFLWVHLFDPHAPYRSGSYASEIAIVDREIGALVGDLRGRDLWGRTVLSVTADHGESLGEHGELTHGLFVYDSTLRIPWVMHAPGRPPARVRDQVRIIDVLPTMADLGGQGALLQPGGPLAGIDGVSLRPALEGGPAPQLTAYAESWLSRHQFGWSELRALRTARAKFIAAPRPELYDLERDPIEQRNVAGERPAEVEGARRSLVAIERRAAGPARPQASDPVMAERLMSLGYVGFAPAPPSRAGQVAQLDDPKDKLPVYLKTMEAVEQASRGERQAALASIAELLALDPNVAQAHFLQGSLLGDLGRLREAAAALERTLALNPRYLTARFKLALALLRLGDTSRAERELGLVLDEDPANVRAWHNLAALAYARDDLPRAEKLERKALATDPTYAEGWNTLGAIFIETGRLPDAIDALERATKLAPRNGQVFANLAIALDRAGRATDAESAQQTACTLDPRYCAR
jgi:arylsulfatase A-like enzyme/Flp pilus assembly protein TadD